MVASVVWAIALVAHRRHRRARPSPFRRRTLPAAALPTIHDPFVFLGHFVERIASYDTHTQGHPPGMVLLAVGARPDRARRRGRLRAARVAGGAAAGAAALVAVREVAGERAARAGPRRSWSSRPPRSGGSRATRSSPAWRRGRSRWSCSRPGERDRTGDGLALAGGLLFGHHRVLVVRTRAAGDRSRRGGARSAAGPAARVAAAGAAPVFIAFFAAGFSWFAGLAATRQRVLARRREAPAVLATSSLAELSRRSRSRSDRRLPSRSPGCATAGSGCSSAVPWPRSCSPTSAHVEGRGRADLAAVRPVVVLAAASVLAEDGAPQPWLALQAASAIAVELAVRSPW